jgi:SsrA-binding protein
VTAPDKREILVVARNRKARHELRITRTVEAGLALTGTEVKALRQGLISLDQAWAVIEAEEVWLRDVNIGEYGAGSWTNHTPRRKRKLLLHRKEIRELADDADNDRTLVPLEVFFNERGFAKVLIGVGEGLQRHDRRENLKRKEAERDMRQALKRRR